MNADAVLTGGGTAAFLIALTYVGRLVFDWWQQRRGGRASVTGAVGDAVAVNGILQTALNEEREEVQRLSGRIEDLENQNALLYERLRDQRRDYEREVAELRKRVDDLVSQVEAFQQRLHNPPPLP